MQVLPRTQDHGSQAGVCNGGEDTWINSIQAHGYEYVEIYSQQGQACVFARFLVFVPAHFYSMTY